MNQLRDNFAFIINGQTGICGEALLKQIVLKIEKKNHFLFFLSFLVLSKPQPSEEFFFTYCLVVQQQQSRDS